MPKIDFSKSIEFDKTVRPKRKEMAERTVNNMIGDEATFNLLKNAKVFELPIEDIDAREVNEFDDISLTTLKESILRTGLQHNLVVLVNGDRYTVISGNRRLSAIKELHSEYPLDERFNSVPCKICQIIGEGVSNSDYAQITKEQEEIIYKDTNFENRQLGLETAIRHIDYLAEKIENSDDFYKRALSKSNENSIYNKKVFDKPSVIADILTNNLGFSGWSKSSVYRILKIREKDPSKLEKIASGELPILNAYKELFPTKSTKKKNKSSYKTVYKSLEKIQKEIDKIDKVNSTDENYIDKIKELCEAIINKVDEE